MKENMLKILLLALILVVGFFMIKNISSPKENIKERTKIVFFGLGKADSIYIENRGKSILIDTGLKSQNEILIEKLRDLNVEKLDYVILTHGDKDHIGSASYILENFEIGQVIQSRNIKDTKRQGRIDQVIEEKQIKNTIAKEDMKFKLGDLDVSIFTPKKDYYEKDNDYSLVTLIEDGELNYLFAGDAEEELLNETLEIDLPEIDLYKVAHHGRENPNSQKMIKKILPKYSVITNPKKDIEIERFLKAAGSQVKYVVNEDFQCISDGKKLKFY